MNIYCNNAARNITRTLRRREQYRLAVTAIKAVWLVIQFVFAAALLYAFLWLGLAL
jgi:hypothetical protein